MTRLPRDIDAEELVVALRRLRYAPVRQTGSHIRLVTDERGGHKVTVPAHRPIRVGTLGNVLGDVALHFGLSRQELLDRLFG